MDHSRNTKLNDAVTYRQFSRFLVHAQIPPSWKQEVICLEDVLHMPVIFQDKLFSDWISQYLKKDDKYPNGKPYPNNQYLLKQMSLQRLYRDIQYKTWHAQQIQAAAFL